MPYPSEASHPLRRWALTVFLTVVVFFGCFSLVEVVTTTDEEADRAAFAAEQAQLEADRQALSQAIEKSKQNDLCGVIAYLVQRSNASLPSIDYYQDHPDELKAAQSANAETLRILDCKAIVPPPAAELLPSGEYRDYGGRN